MNQNGKTLFGNEWIDQSKTYHRFYVNEDGIYRISNTKLQEIGIASSDIERLQIWNFGKQIAINIESGHIEFVGYRNTKGLDTFLYENWKKDLLNEDYSLITDDNAYYLSIAKEGESVLRYKKVTTPGSSNYPRLQSFQYNQKINLGSTFYKPEIAQLKYSHFVSSEGYTDGLKNDFLRSILTPNRAVSGDVTLYYSTATSSNFKQLYDVSLNGKSIKTDSVGFLTTHKVRINLNNGDLQENNTLRIKGQNANLLLGVSHVSLIYPRTFNMSGITFTTIKNPESEPRLIEFQQLSDQINYFYDITNQQMVQVSAANKSVVIEGNGNLIYSSNTREINNFEKITPFNLPSNLSYLLVSSKKLAKTPRGQEGLDRYKAYRNSSKGGRFTSEVVYVEDIYDYFGYGVPNHPHAFKNFAHFLKANYSSLEYVLLVGKGREYNTIRTKEQLNQANNQTFFIPTYGNSPSDILLFSKAEEAVPFFALGRIAAKNGDDINNYLDKVIEHDLAKEAPQTKEKLWLKNIIHLGGGANNGEQSAIRRFLEQMADTIKSNQFGGMVNGFYKTTTTSVQTANIEGIYTNMNFGTAIITYFGHASVGTFEYNLDNPRSYNNKGKYPYIFSLGCYSGNIHTTGFGISEDFVFAKDGGAIGFIAAAGTATLYSQGIYGVDYYDKIGNQFYGKSIGELLKLIGEENRAIKAIDPFTFFQQLTLNGDPAVKFASFETPDYLFDAESINIKEGMVSEDLDSINMNIDLLNIGRGVDETIEIKFTLKDSDNKIQFEDKILLNAPKSVIDLNIPFNIKELSPGLYKVEFEIMSQLDLNKSNNTFIDKNGKIGYEFLISGQSLNPFYPENYAVINKREKVYLQAYSVNALVKNRDFIIEIDTIHTFNSPTKESFKGSSQRSFVEYFPKSNLIDGQTYYWRVSYVRNTDTLKSWKTCSFTFDTKAEDQVYSLRDRGQFLNGKFDGINLESGRTWKFDLVTSTIQVNSGMYDGNRQLGTFNGNKWSSIAPFGGNVNSFNVTIWTKEGILFNTNNPHNQIKWETDVFVFDMLTQSSRQNFVKLIESAPEDATIIVYVSYNNLNSNFNVIDWKSDFNSNYISVDSTLKKYGSLNITDFASGQIRPYIFAFSKKNGVIKEYFGSAKNELSSLSIPHEMNNFQGEYLSPIIGPIRELQKIAFEVSQETKGNKPKHLFRIYKINSTGGKSILLDSIKESIVDFSSLDLNDVNKIQIKFLTENGFWVGEGDPIGIKTINFKFKTLPDLLLKSLSEIPDTVNQGEALKLTLQIHKINSNLDSTSIKFTIKNDGKEYSETKRVKISTQPIVYNISTENLKNKFSINAIVNEENSPPEFNTTNNSGNAEIITINDQLNPKIELLIDGIKIMNGDIIAPSSIFKITASDNSKFLPLNKRENVWIELITHKTGKNEIIDLANSQNVKFTPGTVDRNIATYELPMTLADGEYTVNLNVKDIANNVSGNNNYSVSFSVISTIGVKELTNYPNPFSSKTRFVYQLTGGVPTDLALRIYTISGKLVREFTGPELGNNKIGNNISDIEWDGRDVYGNKLANGVYLMKLFSNDYNKTAYENSKTITKGFSKIVIIN